MVRLVLMGLVISVATGWSAATMSAQAGESCSCQYFGQHLKVGTKICMKSWKGTRVATCEFELNNTSWKISDQKCSPLAWKIPKDQKVTVAVLDALLKAR